MAWFSAGVAIAPLLAAYGLFMDFASFGVVANQGFGAIAILEIIANAAIITLAVWGLTLLRARRRLAVRVLISLMLVSAAISLIDLGFVMYLQAHFGVSAGSTQAAATSRSIIITVIWVPYFLRSSRVKATLIA